MDRNVIALGRREVPLAPLPLQRLAEVAKLLNSTLSLEEKVQQVTEVAAAMLEAQQARLQLTFASPLIPPLAAHVLTGRLAEQGEPRLPLSHPLLCALVCQTNEPLRLTQAELQGHPKRSVEAPLELQGWLAVPL